MSSEKTPEEQIQDLLIEMNEKLQRAKEIAIENNLKFSVGEILFSPMNSWKNNLFETDAITVEDVYVSSDWYDSGC